MITDEQASMLRFIVAGVPQLYWRRAILDAMTAQGLVMGGTCPYSHVPTIVLTTKGYHALAQYERQHRLY